MEKAVNHFYEGINTDAHVEMRNDKVLLENEGFRTIDVEGHGLVNISVAGNHLDLVNEIGFEITPGFIPQGKFTYKGITFVLSYNDSDKQFEIGSFPSPKQDNTGGFVGVYKPLFNYTGDDNPLLYQNQNPLNESAYQTALLAGPIRQPFRINKANEYPWFIGKRPIQTAGRLNHDNSVNIYFADGVNPVKVINCGFNIFTGFFTRRAYCNEMFKHAIHVFNETDKPAKLVARDDKAEVEIGYNGRFKCGNVQFYFRYSDEEFNPTSYQSHSGMVSIIPSNENETTNSHILSGGDGDTETNKSVKLRIHISETGGWDPNQPNQTVSRIDQAYKYLEIAYVRHFDNGAMEAFRLVKGYEIQELIKKKVTTIGYSYVEIEVTNFEDLIQVTPAEIIKVKRQDVIALDLTVAEDRLWAGNTKVSDENYEVLYHFAQQIRAVPVLNSSVNDSPATSNTFNGNTNVGYKYYLNAYEYAHYMCGETYAFGVQFLLKSTGKWSDSFPVLGGDYYNYNVDVADPSAILTNTKGIVRMPAISNVRVFENPVSLRTLGIEFQVPATNYTFNGIKLLNYATAIRFTRPERKKNLLYQGVICKAFCSNSEISFGDYALGQRFCLPRLNLFYPYAYNPYSAVGSFKPNASDGRDYQYSFNDRVFPSPFEISLKADGGKYKDDDGNDFGYIIQNAAIYWDESIAQGTAHYWNWYDPFQYIPGEHQSFPFDPMDGTFFGKPKQAVKRHWLRCDVPFKIFVNSFELDGDDSILHWYNLGSSVALWDYRAGNHPSGYNGNGVLYDTNGSLNIQNSNGYQYRGVSFKTDKDAWHRGPVNTIPGWKKGYWGIYSVEYAISKAFNDSNYFVKKIGEAEDSKRNKHRTGDGIYQIISQSVVESDEYWNHDPVQQYAINRILNDFEGWKYSGFGPSRITYAGTKITNTQTYNGYLTKIDGWVTMPNKYFCSYFKEGNGDGLTMSDAEKKADGNSDAVTSDSEELSKDKIYIERQNSDFHFYFFRQHNQKGGRRRGVLEIANLEFAVAPYIGVDFTHLGEPDNFPFLWHNDLVAVYLVDPDKNDFDITNWYNPSNETYFPIGNHYYLQNDLFEGQANNVTEFRGDSFPAHTYIKTMTNPIYNPQALDDDYKGFVGRGKGHPGFGQILGYAAEHSINVGLRHAKPSSEQKAVDELDYESYYPAIDAMNPKTYAIFNRARESFRYNEGYSKQLSLAASNGFDIQIPFREVHYQDRIIYSTKQTAEAIQDSWRDIGISSYKDFEGQHGNLNRIVGAGGRLYSIFDHGIKVHPINELVQQVTNSGTIVVGQQAETLPDKAGVISDSHGIQGTTALGVSDQFIYGFDYNKRAIWSIPIGGNQFQLTSVKNAINTLLYNAIENLDQFSDVRKIIKNEPMYGEGVSIGYNRKYKEVWFSFQKKGTVADRFGNPTYSNLTLIFSEVTGKFTTTYHNLFMPMFITINEDFYSLTEQIKNGKRTWSAWLMDQTKAGINDNYNTFFGVLRDSWFSVVVNQNSSAPKVFDNVHIQVNDIEPLQIEYKTQYQNAVHTPWNTALTPLYIRPKYRENKWELAIKRADSINVPVNHYTVGSQMRGNHLVVKVKYRTKLPIFVKSIITGFRPSNH